MPKEYRIDGHEVRVRRHGNAIILEPLAADWSWLDDLAAKLDSDFVEATEERAGPRERQQ